MTIETYDHRDDACEKLERRLAREVELQFGEAAQVRLVKKGKK